MIIVLPRYNVTSYLSARISNHLTEFRKIIKNARTSRHRIPTQARQIITRQYLTKMTRLWLKRIRKVIIP